jgi:hypothetical protein
MENKNSENAQKEVQTTLNVQTKNSPMNFDEMEKDLNLKILKITLSINDQYPELSKYLEEMSVTIPDEKTPEITIKNLQTYYDSLNSMLNKYILEHSDIKK